MVGDRELPIRSDGRGSSSAASTLSRSQPLLPGVLLLDFGLYPSGPVSSEQPENGEQHESSHTSPLLQILLQFKLHSEGSQSPTGLLECPLRASVICPAKCSYCFSHTNSLGHIHLPIGCLSAVEPFPWMPIYLQYSFSKKTHFSTASFYPGQTQ